MQATTICTTNSTQEGDDLCLGEKQQGAGQMCLYRAYGGGVFQGGDVQGEISSPELVARPGIGVIWGLLGFQAQGLVIF